MNTMFSFQSFPQLETDRFILRKSEEWDVRDIFELYSNKEVMRYTPLSPFSTQEDAVQEMYWHWEIFTRQIGLRWVMEEKQSGKVIGSCGFLNYSKENSRTEIGYDLTPSFWRQGMMAEAAARIVAFGFREMGLNRIEAKVEPANIASIRLLTKLGFHQEDQMRKYEFEKGRFMDLLIFSLLRQQDLP
ncbi:GNAT family N-acetyltransferase [Paenibacillus sp. sgz302251]|uniref:GNAT family N-acetyltransferase n=1 Tax=Paenibacillus sp. sgz302251 TaxID=3414493 RepID=UPI003C7BF5CE